MKTQHSMTTGQHSRRDARVCGWAAFAAATLTVVVPMLGTPTAKINPRVVPGGLPKEGNP